MASYKLKKIDESNNLLSLKEKSMANLMALISAADTIKEIEDKNLRIESKSIKRIIILSDMIKNYKNNFNFADLDTILSLVRSLEIKSKLNVGEDIDLKQFSKLTEKLSLLFDQLEIKPNIEEEEYKNSTNSKMISLVNKLLGEEVVFLDGISEDKNIKKQDVNMTKLLVVISNLIISEVDNLNRMINTNFVFDENKFVDSEIYKYFIDLKKELLIFFDGPIYKIYDDQVTIVRLTANIFQYIVLIFIGVFLINYLLIFL